jgi:translation initiation factor IF-1
MVRSNKFVLAKFHENIFMHFAYSVLKYVLIIQSDQKVSVHLMNTVQHTKILQTVSIAYHDKIVRIRITDGVSVSLASRWRISNVWRLAGDILNITCNFVYCNLQVHRGVTDTQPSN